MTDPFARELASKLLEFATRDAVTIACAESCTGGLIGSAITEIPGSSSAFLGGVISYSNDIKQRVLGVDQSVIQEHGVVSAACAAQMAQGVLRVTNADLGVSVTGVAGPGGGSAAKPVGTVWIGRARRNEAIATCIRLQVPQERDRGEIRDASTHAALKLMLEIWEPQSIVHEHARERV